MTKGKPVKIMHVDVKAMIDSDDPRTNVVALLNITKGICDAMGKTPAEGAVMLMTAAAAILDQGNQAQAKKDGEEYDPGNVIPNYMQLAAHGWNLSAMLFRGVTQPELGEVTEVGGEGATLQ